MYVVFMALYCVECNEQRLFIEGNQLICQTLKLYTVPTINKIKEVNNIETQGLKIKNQNKHQKHQCSTKSK